MASNNKVNTFKTGDKVRPFGGDKLFVENYCGVSLDGTYTVSYVSEQLVRLTCADSFASTGRGISHTRLKLVEKVRIEGAEISPADIEIGDEILVTRTGHNITHMRKGVVGEIARQNHSGLDALLFKTEGQYHGSGERLNWGMDYTETIVLVKAVPERDKLLDRLVGALAGTVVTYRESWARKHGDEKWDVVVLGRLSIVNTDVLRNNISDSPVTFLTAEK